MNSNFHTLDDENTIQDFELQSLAAGRTLCGEKYRLEKEAGAGGMGVVWKAWDQVGERWVALKFVPPEIRHSEGAMAQVKTAFQTIQALSHTNICRIHALEKDAVFGYFVVMEWLDGQPLNAVKLPKAQIPAVLGKVADALDYAHAEKVVHRDVKPSNIFLGANGKVWLIDFGIAAEIQNSISMNTSSTVCRTSGTRPYMAPEQWRGQRQDGRADQYALGVVAYQLYAGHLPFENPDLGLLCNAVLNFPPEEIDDVPPAVNAAIQRALSKDRKARFATCREFIDALASLRKDDVPVVLRTSSSAKTAIDQIVEAERRAAEAKRRAEEEAKQKRIQDLTDSAVTAYQSQNYTEAITCLNELLKIQPDHPNYQYMLKRSQEELEIQKKEEAERKARKEAARKAREEAERKASEEAARKASEEAARKAREEAERKAREEAERKAREEAERKAREEAERKAREDAARKVREEAERKAREEAERKAREEAERKALETKLKACETCDFEGTVLKKYKGRDSHFTIPEGVTEIGIFAFRGCSSLTSVVIPDSVQKIGIGAFAGCTALKQWSISSDHPYFKTDGTGLLTKDGKKLLACLGSATEYRIPEGVTEIGRYAFWGCSSLMSVVIPEGVKVIGVGAFWGCSSLTSVVIPEGVTEIGSGAFYGCSSLTSVEIPEGVTKIGGYAFDGCRSLTSVVIPEGVTRIGWCAFSGCSSLTSVVIPEGVTVIGGRAFYGCSSLTSVKLPKGVEFGESVFGGCPVSIFSRAWWHK